MAAIPLWVLAVLAAILFLREASSFLIPIAVGTLISYALEPLVAGLERHRIPRMVGTGLLLGSLLAAAGVGAFLLRDDLATAAQAIPSVVQRARAALGDTLGSLGIEQPATSEAMTGGVFQRGVSSLLAAAGHVTVVFFLVFFLLLYGHHVRDRIVEIAGPSGERRTAATIMADITEQIQRYLLVLLVTAVVVAAATWIVLAALGVQNAWLWGLLAGVFNSIPYFGPVIVSAGLLAVGALQEGGLTQGLQMAGAALVITSLEGWLLTPALMGKAERMSALAVFLGLLLWTWVWGAWGTILAVPMLAVIKAVTDHVPRLKPVSRLLAP